ncbi:hypothetical protein [Micromonospora sp. KC207]|uniref:hypothetical protein n=1 Tax=Micromonospora sp. KC207 TaxID=2530377 RepID=UPI001404A378|nr:hypothetical protein [Micromonospora sp. KC207]
MTEALAAVPQLAAKWRTGTDPRLGPSVAGTAFPTGRDVPTSDAYRSACTG